MSIEESWLAEQNTEIENLVLRSVSSTCLSLFSCRKANPHVNVEEILFFQEAELECSIWVAVSSAGLGQSKNLILVCFSFIIQRFVECVIKLLRKEFDYRCPLTVAQVPLMKRKYLS